MTRIALVTEIPAPFRIPLFNELAAHPDVELDVLLLALRSPTRPYPVYYDEFAFRWRQIRGHSLTLGGRWFMLNRGLGTALRAARPDMVIVGGWNQPAFWRAALFCGRRIPLCTWVESTARDARSGARPLEWAKQALLRRSTAAIVPGKASADYVRGLGWPPLVHTAPNAVDAAIFGRRSEGAGEREASRAGLGLTRCTFLYVGRLAPEKGVDVLIEAVRGGPYDVLVLGTGALEAELKQAAPPNVRFIGHVPRDRLPDWYSVSDAFVLPSRSEQWGMVLNEAVTSGLPIVSTDAPGAAHDLVEDGVNGYRVPSDDIPRLRAAMDAMAADSSFRRSASTHSLRIAERYTPARWASAVAELASTVADSAHRPI